MKKLLIPLILLLSSLSASAQIADTTYFNHAKPMLGYTWYNMEFWTDSALFHGSIHAASNIKTDGNLTVNDTLFWNTIYPTPFDSSHCWSELNINTINGCPADQIGNSLLTLNTTRVKANSDLYVTDSLYVANDIKVTGMIAGSDTLYAPFIRLKDIHTTGTVLTEVTSTGLLDTIATVPINPIYLKKSGDTMGGNIIMNSGSILFDDYAFASGDKVAVIHESGLLDTTQTVTVDNAVIGSLTISDSIRIGGLWYIGDTAIIADEDSITIPVNRSMFGQIFVDSAGYMVAYANSFYVDINGTPHLISPSSRVITTNTDTNAICLYAYAGNLILRNRSGSTLKYKIILNG